MKKEEWKERHLSDEELTRDRNAEIRKTSRSYSPNPMSLEKAKKDSRKKRRKIILISWGFVFIATVIFCAVCFQIFFKLNRITVENCTKYTKEQVLQGSGLVIGENLYKLDKKTIQKNIDKNLPYIAHATVTRIWPSTISINVSETNDNTYIDFGGSYYILSEELRVLEKTGDIERIESQNILHLYCGTVKKCIVGEYLELADHDNTFTIIEIMKNMKKANVLEECSELNLNNKFDITFTYQKRYKVKLGDGYDTDIKIDFMKAIGKKLYEGETGTIDVSDSNLREGVVIRDS